MKILFIHQNFPGQYLNLVRHLRNQGGHEILGLGEADNIRKRGVLRGISTLGYPSPLPAGQGVHHYLRGMDAAVRRGQAVARTLFALRAKGYVPDVVSLHPGWGEGLFVRDVYPRVPILVLCEFFFTAAGADVGFDPEFTATLDDLLALRVRNAVQLITLHAGSAFVSPTAWQRSRYPVLLRREIRQIHDGVDTDYMCPDPRATLVLVRQATPGESRVAENILPGPLPDGSLVLTPGGRTITFAARNLEPYRGIHAFLRALPEVQRRHPDCQVVLAGGDGVSYSRRPPKGRTYKEIYLEELSGRLDLSRIHFLGRVSYDSLRTIFRISAVHVYLTYPFVLSWSALEAMACGCLLLASRTAPVQEVVVHNGNGLLVDFFRQDELADSLDRVLRSPGDFTPLRAAARKTVISRYGLAACLEAQAGLVLGLAAAGGDNSG
ncbi:MAG: glycosyltransferase [Desulfovibrio sp.]|jgi:glycosyltransferase involved in cell wall biosynthesis|nr:glycosyltransferase [Desulfovibrio sp.]